MSTVALILIGGLLMIGAIASAIDSTELDEVCAVNERILYRQDGTWQCAQIQLTDTNETTRFNNLISVECSSGNFIYNVTEDGTPQCGASAGSGDITSVQTDGLYLYNGSDNGDVGLKFNETKLNETINALATGVSDGFWEINTSIFRNESGNLGLRQDQIEITESQITNLDHYTDADISGSETAFDGWDKNAGDDFDGAYNSLTGKPDLTLYNQTLYIDAVNTTTNIENLGFTTGTHTIDTDTNCNATGSCSDGFVAYFNATNNGYMNLTEGLNIQGNSIFTDGNGNIVATNGGGALVVTDDSGQGGAIDFAGNTASIGISSDGEYQGYDYTGAMIFKQKASNPTSIGEYIFIEETGDWRFALPSSGANLGTYNPRSMIIAGPSMNNETNFGCLNWGFDQIDCNTSDTGADLGVQDDLQVGDKIIAGDWSNVTITENQITDLTSTTDTRWDLNTTIMINQSGNLGINDSAIKITESQIIDLTHTIDTNTQWTINETVLNNQTGGILGIVQSFWDNLYLAISDQRYNNTAYIDAVNTTANIENLGFVTGAHTIDTNESTRVDTLITSNTSQENKMNAINTTANIELLGFVTGAHTIDTNESTRVDILWTDNTTQNTKMDAINTSTNINSLFADDLTTDDDTTYTNSSFEIDSIPEGDNTYVDITGDVMSGDLQVPNINITGYANYTASDATIRYFSNGCYEKVNSSGIYIIC